MKEKMDTTRFSTLEQVLKQREIREGEKALLNPHDFIGATKLLLPQLREAFITVSQKLPGGYHSVHGGLWEIQPPLRNGKLEPVKYMGQLTGYALLATKDISNDAWQDIDPGFKLLCEMVEEAFPNIIPEKVNALHCYDYWTGNKELSQMEFAGLVYHVKRKG